MSKRLDGDDTLCDEYYDSDGPLIECDLAKNHEGDCHAIVTWPRRTPAPAGAQSETGALVQKIWGKALGDHLKAYSWVSNIRDGADE